MATGDAADIHARLKRLMPRWFGQDQNPTPVLDGLLQGPSTVFAWAFGLIVYARAQSRIATATGAWLDLSAADFFGRSLRRRSGETDTTFSARIRASIVAPGATRAALIAAITDANEGVGPSRVFETERPLDTGAYDTGWLGYDVAGGYGADAARGHVFVDVPAQAAPPPYLQAGLDSSFGGWSETEGRFVWSSPETIIPDQIFSDILAAIERVRPAGVSVWVRFV